MDINFDLNVINGKGVGPCYNIKSNDELIKILPKKKSTWELLAFFASTGIAIQYIACSNSQEIEVHFDIFGSVWIDNEDQRKNMELANGGLYKDPHYSPVIKIFDVVIREEVQNIGCCLKDGKTFYIITREEIVEFVEY